jgi:hypothetical protein
MRIDPKFKAPSLPFLSVPDLKEGEAETLRSFNLHLFSLASFSDEITAAVALFDFSRINDQVCHNQWPMLAAKSGALNLRNFRQALEKVLTFAGKIEVMRAVVDTAALKEAMNKFDSQFNRVDLLRHAVAHPENYSNPKKNMTNRDHITIPGMMDISPGKTIQNALLGRTYASTIDGEFLTYDLSADTVLTLVGITKMVYEAVDGANPYSPKYYWRGQ